VATAPFGVATGSSVAAQVTAERAHPSGPIDLIRSREWPLTALHVPQAWKYSKGAGVTVAVLDTGVDGRHPDLVGRVIQGPDYTGRGRRPGSPYWGRHGTAMASIIAGHGHGPGHTSGVMGVAPLAKILSIRVTWENDDPERTDRDQINRTGDAVAKGIKYAVDHGAQIINMSLGGGKMIYNGNPIEEEAVRYALSRGAMLIASAGNDGAGLNRTNFPAAYPGVLAVGAVDKTMRPAKFTNRHDYVSVAAPGVDIVSADAGRSYVQGTGTSPSAAIVAGIAALVRSNCPTLSPDQTRLALERGTTHRPPGGRNTKIGAGVTDAVKAIYAGHQICKTPPTSQPVPAAAQPAGATAHAERTTLPLIGILIGGGSLLVVSLFMGWRQRARRPRVEEYAIAEEYEEHEEHEPAVPRPMTSIEPTKQRVPMPVGAPIGGAAVNGRSPADAHTVTTPANGTHAVTTPANGTHAVTTPANGTPVNGTPVNGTPVNGTRVNGTSAVSTPANGIPVAGAAVNGTPLTAGPPAAGGADVDPDPADDHAPTMPLSAVGAYDLYDSYDALDSHDANDTQGAYDAQGTHEAQGAPQPLATDEAVGAPSRYRDEYGDDPLGTGTIDPMIEVHTPLADQSWAIVLRGRQRPPGA
jgi:type VII secretion-associated serine protease mycosin